MMTRELYDAIKADLDEGVLSQHQIARKRGTNQGQVSRIHRGVINRPEESGPSFRLTVADVEIGEDGEGRIQDLKLGLDLGYTRPDNIRNLIERNKEELETYGKLLRYEAVVSREGRGEVGGFEYRLNERQCLVVIMKSGTPEAAGCRRHVIEVFLAAKRGASPPSMDLALIQADMKNLIGAFTALQKSIVERDERQLAAWTGFVETMTGGIVKIPDAVASTLSTSREYIKVMGGIVGNTEGYINRLVVPEFPKIIDFMKEQGQRQEAMLRKVVDNTEAGLAPKEEPQRAEIKIVKVGHYDQSYRTSHKIAIANGYPKDERSKGMTNSLTSEIERFRHEKMGIFEIYIDDDSTRPVRKHDRKTVERWLDEGGRETINAWTAKALAKAEAKERDD